VLAGHKAGIIYKVRNWPCKLKTFCETKRPSKPSSGNIS